MMSPKEIQEIIDDYTYHLKNGLPISEDFANAMKDASVGIKDYSRNLKASKDALIGSAKQLGMAMVNGESGASVYNNTIKAGAKTFSSYAQKIPRVGKALGAVAEGAAEVENAIAKQADALFESYQSLSRSGVATGMQDAFNNLQDMGYTMKEIGQYGELMKQNSSTLATLGGTTADGAKKFAAASKNIKNSGLETQFMRMGMTVGDINNGMANYVKFQQMSGSTIQQDDKQIARSAAEFIIEQDKLTKMTGLSADQQNKIYEGALAQEQFAAKTFQLQQIAAKGGAEGAKAEAELKRNRAMIEIAGKYGPEVQKQAQLYIAGAVNSKGFQQFQRSYSELADYLDKGGNDIGKAGDLMTKGAKETLTSQSALFRYGAGNELYGDIAEKMKMVSTPMGQFTKANNDATQQQKDQAAAKDEQVGNMVDVIEDQRDASASMNQALNVGVPLVTKGLSKVSDAGQQLAGVLGQMAGKEGQMGGGTTLWEKAKSVVGLGSSSGKVPPVSGTPPAAAGKTPDLDSFINFGGNTGDKSHFMQLNPTVLNSFVQMAKAYFDTTGKKLQVNSAYRSPDEQGSISSGNNPKAAPGKSLHNVGKALDINSSQRSELASNGLLAQYGFSLPPFQDPPHIQMPSAATGGILSGPLSGYQAMLHGNEAVVPLPDGKTIPIQSKGSSGSSEQIKLLTSEIDKLDAMLRVMSKQNDITNKILQRQS